MNRLLLLPFFAFWLLPCAPCAQAGNAGAPLAPVAAWVDKYPFDSIQGRSLWGVAAFAKSVRGVLGPRRYAVMRDEYGVGAPVTRRGDVVHVGLCKPHDCDGSGVSIFVDLGKQTVAACWKRSRTGEQVLLAPGAPARPLHDDACFSPDPFPFYFRELGGK